VDGFLLKITNCCIVLRVSS